jgi:hypothetical protein
MACIRYVRDSEGNKIEPVKRAAIHYTLYDPDTGEEIEGYIKCDLDTARRGSYRHKGCIAVKNYWKNGMQLRRTVKLRSME